MGLIDLTGPRFPRTLHTSLQRCTHNTRLARHRSKPHNEPLRSNISAVPSVSNGTDLFTKDCYKNRSPKDLLQLLKNRIDMDKRQRLESISQRRTFKDFELMVERIPNQAKTHLLYHSANLAKVKADASTSSSPEQSHSNIAPTEAMTSFIHETVGFWMHRRFISILIGMLVDAPKIYGFRSLLIGFKMTNGDLTHEFGRLLELRMIGTLLSIGHVAASSRILDYVASQLWHPSLQCTLSLYNFVRDFLELHPLAESQRDLRIFNKLSKEFCQTLRIGKWHYRSMMRRGRAEGAFEAVHSTCFVFIQAFEDIDYTQGDAKKAVSRWYIRNTLYQRSPNWQTQLIEDSWSRMRISWEEILSEGLKVWTVRLSNYLSCLSPQERQSAYEATRSYWRRRLAIWDEYERSTEPIRADMEMLRKKKAKLNSSRNLYRKRLQKEYRQRTQQYQFRHCYPAQWSTDQSADIGKRTEVSSIITATKRCEIGLGDARVRSSGKTSAPCEKEGPNTFSCLFPMIGPTVGCRRFSTSPRTMHTPEHVMQYYRKRQKIWGNQLALGSQKENWHNLVESLGNNDIMCGTMLEREQQDKAILLKAFRNSRGLAKDTLETRLATTQSFIIMRKNLMPFRNNIHFLREVGWGLRRSPYPKLRCLAPETWALARALLEDYESLISLRRTRIYLLYNQKEAQCLLACQSMHKLTRNIVEVNAYLYYLVNGMIDHPLGAKSRDLQPHLKKYQEKASRFQSSFTKVKENLSAISIRRRCVAGVQAIYNCNSFLFSNLVTRCRQTVSTINIWIVDTRYSTVYTLTAKRESMLRKDIQNLKDCKSEIERLVWRDYALDSSSRCLNFLTGPELAAREEAVRRLWVGYWKITKEYDQAMKIIDSGLKTAHKERLKTQQRLKWRKIPDRKKETSDHDVFESGGHRAWWHAIEAGKSKRSGKQGKARRS